MKLLHENSGKRVKLSRLINLRRYSNLPDELSLLRLESPFFEDNEKKCRADCPVCGISAEDFSELVQRMENFLAK